MHTGAAAAAASKETEISSGKGGVDDARLTQLCADAMRSAALVAAKVAAQTGVNESAGPMKPSGRATATDEALIQLDHAAKGLKDAQPAYRAATLGAVGSGGLTTDEAIVRVDEARRLEMFAYHAWRCAVHLVGEHGASADLKPMLINP